MIVSAPSRVRRLTMAARAALKKLQTTGTRIDFRPKNWRGWEIRDAAGLIFWYPERAGDELKSRGLVAENGQITKDGIDEARSLNR